MNVFSFKKKILRRVFKLAPTSKFRIAILRSCGYTIGANCGIAPGFLVSDRSVDNKNMVLGNNVSIGYNVTVITTSSPRRSTFAKFYGIKYENVTIKDNAWLGTGSIILPGVTIGEFSIIAAGTVVDKDVPDFSVAKGNPVIIKKMNKYLIIKLEKIKRQNSKTR